MPKISVLVEGGKATASAPLGPALGPLGVNIGEVVNEINEKTKQFSGMKIPVEVIVDTATKSFEIEVGSPLTSALIKAEAGVEKGAANPKTDQAANLTIEQVKKLAERKQEGLNSYELKKSMKEIIGTCDSMGIFVENKRAKEAMKEFEEGKFDSKISA